METERVKDVALEEKKRKEMERISAELAFQE